jgi:ssDNA-binding Zn-finger/Zn-ribbon topoisomerase 1
MRCPKCGKEMVFQPELFGVHGYYLCLNLLCKYKTEELVDRNWLLENYTENQKRRWFDV